MKKKNWVYVLIILFWTICNILLVGSVIYISLKIKNVSLVKKVFTIFFVSVNAMCLSYFWLNSIKDVMYSLVFSLAHKRIMKKYTQILSPVVISEEKQPSVALLYCTCNDFNEDALRQCMLQKYKNFFTIILDDSSKPEYIEAIDKFAKPHNIRVIRRENKVGFKAGNLNNYLKNYSDEYDYFVVLDSDEIIPSEFILESLNYFYNSDKIGVVQAAHIATDGKNWFQKILGLSVKATSFTAQIMKNFYGANALIGHGMMISKQCYEATKGFPLVVAEDISFAVEIKTNGYEIVYAPNIICEEEFPTDYISLKKRHCKWTQGNVEYMKKYAKEINRSGMTWYEKLDIRLSHFSLPIVPILSLIILISTIILGFIGMDVTIYSSIIFFISVFFLLSPLIPNIFMYGVTNNFYLVIPYFFVSMATYGSLLPMMIKTVILAAFGKKAKFIVTPKESKKISFRSIIINSLDSIAFALCLCVISYFAFNSIYPTLFVTFFCMLAPLVISLANIPTTPKHNKLIVKH